MGKYMALYKCQLCGELQRLSQTANGDILDIEELTKKTLLFQNIWGDKSDMVQVKQRIPHKCKDGSIGVSLFAGYKKIQ